MSGKLSFDGPWSRKTGIKTPCAGLQWKGGPCVDTLCLCGQQFHRCDTSFMNYLRCPKCDRVFMVGDVVELIELTLEEKADLEAFREEVYKPKSSDYVPWTNMSGEDNHGTLRENDVETPVCRDCFEPLRSCSCLCLREQVEALKKENWRLRKALEKMKGTSYKKGP